MAINFGDTIMEGSIEPTARVQQPVQDNSGAVLAESLGGAARAVGAIAGSIFKQGQEDANSKILTQYENDLLDIADAVDQNTMSRNEAMIKARNLRRQYLSNAPALQDDFDTVWTDFAGANGLGHVVIQGTQEEQNRIAMQNEAAKLGYTPEEFGLFQSRARQATELNYQLTQAQNSGQLITETQKLQGLQAVVGVAQSAYPSAQRQINDAMAKIRANPDSKTEEAAALNNVIGNSIAQLKFVGGSADSAYVTAPIEQAMDTFNKWVNGEVENSVMENTLKSTQLKYDLMYATDPIYGPRIAASRLLSSVGMEQQGYQMWDTPSVKALVDLIDGKGNPLNGEEGTQRSIENLTLKAGSITPETDTEEIAEIRTGIEQLIDSVYRNERSVEGDPTAYNVAVHSLGSPEIAGFISQHGISPRYAQQVAGIFKERYEQELLPVVNRAWTEPVPLITPSTISTGDPNAVVGGMQNIPMNQLLEPRWNGNALEFVPTAAYANNPRVIQLAQDVTSGDNSIGVPVNAMINAQSLLTGVDAKTIYEEDFSGRFFGITEEGADGASVAPLVEEQAQPSNLMSFTTEQDLTNSPSPRELTLEDFQPEELEQIVIQTQAAEPEALLNASNPVEFAQSFIGRREDNAEDVNIISSFIRQAAGISINPAQTAWCAAFVDAVLHSTGRGGGTGKLDARSYLNWGKPVSQPQVGDIVVLSRGDPNGWQGHVGFYAGMTADGKVRLLGGNQSNSVSIADYDASKVLGYRRAE